MELKKIEFKFSSGYITPLESDTILWYVFANDFENLQEIHNKFANGEVPFMISNGFDKWFLPKPFYINSDLEHVNETLEEALKNEIERKNAKSVKELPVDVALFRAYLWSENVEYYKAFIIKDKPQSNKTVEVDYKNSIGRFSSSWDWTVPYSIDNVKYSENQMIVYVKIYDEESWNKFFNSMKVVFEKLWWWKWKSRWYWKVSEFSNPMELDQKEKELFEYFEELEKNWKYIILNNYIPSDDEIDQMNIDNTYMSLVYKNAKSISKEIFKGNMKFIWEGSYIESSSKLTWTFYKSWRSFNFWYKF